MEKELANELIKNRNMKRTFEVITTKNKVAVVNGKRTRIKDTLNLQVEVEIDGKLINVGYGYKTWTTQAKEGWDSAIPGQEYTIHHSIWPKEGDVWKYGGRTFILGERSGFIIYNIPLLENGKEVAQVRFEDYYKD